MDFDYPGVFSYVFRGAEFNSDEKITTLLRFPGFFEGTQNADFSLRKNPGKCNQMKILSSDSNSAPLKT